MVRWAALAVQPDSVDWGAPTGAVATAEEAGAHANAEPTLMAPFVEPATEWIERDVCGQFFRSRTAEGTWTLWSAGEHVVELAGGRAQNATATLDGSAVEAVWTRRQSGKTFACFDVAAVVDAGSELVVRWSVGWDVVPSAVKQAVLTAAAAMFVDRTGTGEPIARFRGSGIEEWEDSVIAMVRPWVLRTGAEAGLG